MMIYIFILFTNLNSHRLLGKRIVDGEEVESDKSIDNLEGQMEALGNLIIPEQPELGIIEEKGNIIKSSSEEQELSEELNINKKQKVKNIYNKLHNNDYTPLNTKTRQINKKMNNISIPKTNNLILSLKKIYNDLLELDYNIFIIKYNEFISDNKIENNDELIFSYIIINFNYKYKVKYSFEELKNINKKDKYYFYKLYYSLEPEITDKYYKPLFETLKAYKFINDNNFERIMSYNNIKKKSPIN